MVRSPSCDKVVGLKKGPWTPEEDRKLVAYIQEHGHGSWRALPVKAGLKRCGKSCRLRWTNYLRPDIKRGKFSLQEEQTIIQLHALLGNRWSAIATHLPRRTDNEIKNYWNTHLKKRLIKLGIDPITHRPRITTLGSVTANLSHMTQWENARLEAEARLVRESKLVSNSCHRTRHGSAYLNNKSLIPSFSRSQPLCLDVLKAWQDMMWRNPSNSSRIEPPVSTLDFYEAALAALPIINNQFISTTNLANNIESSSHNDITKNDSVDIPRNPSNNLEISKNEEMPNSFEINDMMYQDNCLMEAFTNRLIGNDDKGSYDGDFEDNVDYWSSVLNKLGNPSTLGSSLF